MTIENMLPGMLMVAKKLALSSSGEYRLGSVVVKSGRILSRGINKYNMLNNLARKYFGYQTIHAEIDALNQIWDKRNIKGTTLFVFRTKKNGEPANSRPCDRCMNAIRDLGVRKIVYTTSIYPFYNVEKV